MGFGDEIMATAEARKLRQDNPNARIIVGDGAVEYWSDIFQGNPNIDRLADVKSNDQVIWLKNYRGHRPYIDYHRSDMDAQMHYLPYRATAGDLYLCETRVAHYQDICSSIKRAAHKPLVFIEPHVDFGQPKDWGFTNWQSLISSLESKCNFVQPSYSGKELLNSVHGVDTTTFQDGCALLSNCEFFIGPEGGLHHAAAALDIPGVVIFGGRISPEITGYPLHTNIYVDLPLSPCGMIAPCDHCRVCMERISVEQVADALLSIIIQTA